MNKKTYNFQLRLLKLTHFIVSILLPIEQVLVNFSADWCSPCRDVLPVFRSLAEKYTSIMFLIVDVDELAVSITQTSLQLFDY